MYRFTLSIDIAATPSRVWRALCDPAEVVQWDSAVIEALDAPVDYPRPGQHVRWRYGLGLFHLLHDRPQEVEEQRKLHSLLSLGPVRYDETYLLEATASGCRLTAELVAWTAIPVIGAIADRLYVGPSAKRAFADSLAAIKRHCEAESP